MRKSLRLFLVLFLLHGLAMGTNYYVDPNGLDNDDGLTPETAWESIDRGNTLGIISPGDTVNVYPGVYTLAAEIDLTQSGSVGNYIVYRGIGNGGVIIDGQSSLNDPLTISAPYYKIQKLTVINAKEHGIQILGTDCQVLNCTVRDAGKDGIRLENDYCHAYGNTISNVGDHGINCRDAGEFYEVYNNTVYLCGKNGIEIQGGVTNCRIINNIIMSVDKGINGASTLTCAHNNIFNNSGTAYDGPSDSAGGMAVDPLLIEPDSGNLVLSYLSPVIDNGMDVGVNYNGSAPDMGAYEKFNVYYVAITGDDTNDGLAPATAWATFAQADANVIAGDTVNILAGTYTEAITLSTSGADNDLIYYKGIEDSTIIDGTGNSGAIILNADYVKIGNITINDAAKANIAIAGSGNVIDNCRINRSGQAGIQIGGGFKNTVQFSVIDSCKTSGILCNTDSNYVYNCTLYDSKTTAIDAFSCDVFTVSNCIFKGGASSTVGVKAKEFATITYSIFDGYSTTLQGGVKLGTGCLEEYPLLIDPVNGDFRLSSESPAIDAGTDLSFPFNGLAPDMGAIETSALTSLNIVHSFDSLFADSQYVFSFEALDEDGNPANPGTITWEHTFATGTIDDTGLYIPQLIGVGTITISSDLGLSDAAGVLEVFPGALTALSISPNADTLTTDESQVFTASGVDSKGNTISDPGTVTWEVQGDIGDIDAGGLFTPNRIGTGFVQVYGPDENETISDTIFVTEGAIAYIETSPASNSVEEGATQQFTALAYDADSNFVSDATGTSVWSTDDPTGSIDASGLYNAGTNVSPPDYDVIALYGGTIADTSTVTVISAGVLSYIRIEYEDGTVVTDETLSTDIDTTTLYCRGYNSGDALLGNTSVTWTLIGDGIGSVIAGPDATTTLTLTMPGTGQIVATHASSIADSTGTITCVTGVPVRIALTRDTLTISADSTYQFDYDTYDADDNSTAISVVDNWEVLNGIGTINGSGLFSPTTAGTGDIVASGAGIVDTTTFVTVVPGDLYSFDITPNTATVGVGDSIQFNVDALDIDGNTTSYGTLSWQVLGVIGNINSDGLYIADEPGICSVMVTSNLGKLDISSTIAVEALYATSIPITTYIVTPGQDDIPVLALRIDNYYNSAKSLTSLTIHDISLGAGNSNDLLFNYYEVGLYYDIDNDSNLTEADSLVCHATMDAHDVAITIDPALEILSGEGRSLFIGAHLSRVAHDGDSLDQFIYASTDISTADGSIVDGIDSINSIGYAVINGLVSEQLTYQSVGVASISSGDSYYPVLSVDIPRNGYYYDTLTSFSVKNEGTATYSDIDTLVLYSDNGNDAWDGPLVESRIGTLIFTGSEWIRSGFSVPLTDWYNRFYVAAWLSPYPEDGTTIALTISENGLEMASENDGPYNSELPPIDTITILTNETLFVEASEILKQLITPGVLSNPLTAFKFTNSYAGMKTVDSLAVTLSLSHANGDLEADLLSQVDSIYLYHNLDGDLELLSDTDTLISAAEITSTTTMISLGGLSIVGGGGTETVTVLIKVNLQNAKNGSTAQVGIQETTDVYSDAATLTIDVPLYNVHIHEVDAFPAEAISINEIEGTTLFGGQSDQPVLDFELPRDGISSARLRQISLKNTGTLNSMTALASVSLWRDGLNDGYSDDDALVGSFIYSSGVWTLSSLNYFMTDPQTRFILTVDIGNDQFIGGTLDFEIQPGSVRYWSGTTGPDDVRVKNADNFLVFPADRITAISIPAPSQTATPGSSTNQIFTFALYNGYVHQSQMLQTILLNNVSQSASGLDFTDYELGQIYLYLDDDRNRVFNRDSLIATGYFTSGQLILSGMNVELTPEELSYFFVISDIPLGCIDSDSLAISIETPSAFSFENSVNINGDLPMTSGGYAIIDGSVKNQYRVIETPSRTISPGDNSVTLFSFIPAYNGDQFDFLESVTIENTLDADTSDISSLTLWQDTNNDSLWQATDTLLGTFAFSGSSWITTMSGYATDTGVLPLFVVADIAPSASPGSEFQGRIPLNGCQFMSDNDGPIDEPLESGAKYTISNSPLRVAYQTMPTLYSIGQFITVTLTTTNLDVTSISDVAAQIINVSNPSIVTFDSSSADPVTIAAGGSQQYSFYYTASAVGTINWQIRAFSATVPDSSAVIQTETISIQALTANVPINLLNSMPNSVTKGQDNVFPLSIAVAHPDSLPEFASLRIDSLMLDVTDGMGGAVNANTVFSNIVLTSGYKILSVIETVEAVSTIKLIFDKPAFIDYGSEKLFSFLVGISADASVSDFALKISDASQIPIYDKNTGTLVSNDPSIAFPLATASCRIDVPATEMVVASESIHSGTANYGQDNLEVMQLMMRHPGAIGSSQIQFTGFSFELTDESGSGAIPSQVIEKLKLQYQSVIIGEITGAALDDANPEVQFSSPITLSAQQSDSVRIVVNVQTTSSSSGFSIQIPDSSVFQVRDLSSGSLLSIATDTLLMSGTAFPMVSDFVTLMNPAVSPQACLESLLPDAIVSGAHDLLLMDIFVSYQATGSYSPMVMDQIAVRALDSTGVPLDPNQLFDRIGFRVNQGSSVFQPFVLVESGDIIFDFTDQIPALQPGDSIRVTLIADVESDVPYDNFTLQLSDNQSVSLFDQSDPEYQPGIALSTNCTAVFPYSTGITDIYLPAGRPHMMFETSNTRIAFAGQEAIQVFESSWTYSSESPQGNISVQGISGTIYSRTPSGLQAISGSSIFSSVKMYLDDALVAEDMTFAGNTLTLTLESPYAISLGDELSLEVECDLRDDLANGSYLILFSDSTFLSLVDQNLATAVYPILTGLTYPLSSAEISVATAELENSFSNYPNPFNISRGEVTTISYNLSENAYVDIEMFTITGEAVSLVTDNAYREAGAYQSDTWDGRNDSGQKVFPGTYFCRITARLDSGKTESYKRKIAVIR